jgi:thiol-disulfide isomerase/thioredoxin
MLQRFILFSIVIIGFSCCSQKTANHSGGSKGALLPDMQLMNAAGEPIQLSSLRGKKVFVNLWATWCPPCVAEMPSIQELYNKTKSENTAFVLISFDKNFETAKNWMLQKNYNLPIFTAGEELPDLFQVQGIPTTFIFNEEGQLIFNMVGSENYAGSKFVKMMTD